MSDDGVTLSVDELVEYCRTQAGLLSGRVETIGEEADDLLDEIDEDIAELRTCLAEHESSTRRSPVSPSTPGPDEAVELESTADGREALDRVVRFERDHDAPAYFDDRQTVLEAVAEPDDSSAE